MNITAGKRMIVVPLPDQRTATPGPATKAIVIESWRPRGSDSAFASDRRGWGDGVLIYSVDAAQSSNGANGFSGLYPFGGAPLTLFREDPATIMARVPEACVPAAGASEEQQRTAFTPCRNALMTQIRGDAFSRNGTRFIQVNERDSTCPAAEPFRMNTIVVGVKRSTSALAGLVEPSDEVAIEYIKGATCSAANPAREGLNPNADAF